MNKSKVPKNLVWAWKITAIIIQNILFLLFDNLEVNMSSQSKDIGCKVGPRTKDDIT